MDNANIPDLLQFCQKDFNKVLNGIERFVKDVLNGSNPIQKLMISEKIQQLNRLCNFSKKEKTKSIASKVDVSINVPDEIWLKIMSYLNCKDIFLGFGKVSKHFNNLIHDPTAIKSIEFNTILLSARRALLYLVFFSSFSSFPYHFNFQGSST